MNDSNSVSTVGRISAVLTGALISILIIINALSDAFTASNPALALTINPLNTNARINIVAFALDEKLSQEALLPLQEITERGIELEPVDARFFSLLGIIEQQNGRDSQALALFRHSLQLLPTEIQALIRLFYQNSVAGDPERAIYLADIITRRWPDYSSQIAPYFPNLLRNKKAYAAALDRFPLQANGTNFIVTSLIANPASYDIADRMVRDWNKRGVNGLQPAINTVTTTFFKNGQERRANFLFLATLKGKNKAASGYVHNGNFTAGSTGNIFDWGSISRAGLQMGITQLPSNLRTSIERSAQAFNISFNNSPARLATNSLYLILPHAKFNISLDYSTLNYKGPNPVELAIMCINGQLLSSIKLLPGKQARTRLQDNFRVPTENCEIQYIRFSNGRFVKSWANRFSGSLFIHKIGITLQGG